MTLDEDACEATATYAYDEEGRIRNWLKPGGILFVLYQEGDVMAKTANENTTVFAEDMRSIGWEYEVRDISEDSYDILMKKREVTLALKEAPVR